MTRFEQEASKLNQGHWSLGNLFMPMLTCLCDMFYIVLYPYTSKYLLRFVVLGMFWGVQIPSQKVFGCLGY